MQVQEEEEEEKKKNGERVKDSDPTPLVIHLQGLRSILEATKNMSLSSSSSSSSREESKRTVAEAIVSLPESRSDSRSTLLTPNPTLQQRFHRRHRKGPSKPKALSVVHPDAESQRMTRVRETVHGCMTRKKFKHASKVMGIDTRPFTESKLGWDEIDTEKEDDVWTSICQGRMKKKEKKSHDTKSLTSYWSLSTATAPTPPGASSLVSSESSRATTTTTAEKPRQLVFKPTRRESDDEWESEDEVEFRYEDIDEDPEEEEEKKEKVATGEEVLRLGRLESDVTHLHPYSMFVVSVLPTSSWAKDESIQALVHGPANPPLSLIWDHLCELSTKARNDAYVRHVQRYLYLPDKKARDRAGEFPIAKERELPLPTRLPPSHVITHVHQRVFKGDNPYWCVRVRGEHTIYVTFISEQEAGRRVGKESAAFRLPIVSWSDSFSIKWKRYQSPM